MKPQAYTYDPQGTAGHEGDEYLIGKTWCKCRAGAMVDLPYFGGEANTTVPEEALREQGVRVRRPIEGEPTKGLLSESEREAFTLACQGKTGKESAQELGVTHRAIQSRLNSTYKKLGAKSLIQAYQIALRLGIIDDLEDAA